jgi:hypothetical protein
MTLTESKGKSKITLFFDPITEEVEEYGIVEYCVQIQRDGVDIMQEYPQEKMLSSEACKILQTAKIKEMEVSNEAI